jgi:hypothetical protein
MQRIKDQASQSAYAPGRASEGEARPSLQGGRARNVLLTSDYGILPGSIDAAEVERSDPIDRMPVMVGNNDRVAGADRKVERKSREALTPS